MNSPGLPLLFDNDGHAVVDLREYSDVEGALLRIKDIYAASSHKVKSAFEHFVQWASDRSDTEAPRLSTVSLGSSTTISDMPSAAESELDTYPFVAVVVPPHKLNVTPIPSFGVALEAGTYGTTVTKPDVFEDYLREQLGLLLRHHGVSVYVAYSSSRIPLPFVGERMHGDLPPEHRWMLEIEFASADLSRIDDKIANGEFDISRNKNRIPRPLSLFTAERVDFSLDRLYHYTGTAIKYFQRFVLLTNYSMYTDQFLDWCHAHMQEDPDYTALVEPGDHVTFNSRSVSSKLPHSASSSRVAVSPQCPAYHLVRPDGNGITFINIGVGPSNSKTITDHLAVLRPHCWIMLGHCAGLRRSQNLGDYVLAHAYVREDRVLDNDLPLWIPVPPIEEVQAALLEGVAAITAADGLDIKRRLRTGTVVTTDNRNWELRTEDINTKYRQSRAIAVDMESATLAANGFRFRVPYGTLLCVSDKPLHGELKLRGMANQFYRTAVRQHLLIGLHTVVLLRSRIDTLHSRKLRGFDEPPFR